MNWLLRYWELKLVSLVVAISLWVYTSGQIRVERQALVEVRSEGLVGLPANLQPVGITPSGFTVVLSVPARRLDELPEGPLRLRLPVRRDDQKPGVVSFSVTAHTLGLSPDVRIVRTEPADLRAIEITLARMTEQPLPVQVPAVEGLPPGLAATVTPSLTRVLVRGPEDELRLAGSEGRPVRFAPIRLAGIDAGLTGEQIETVTLEPMPALLAPVEAVQARISIRPARILHDQVRCEVQVLLAPAGLGRWQIDPGEPQVSLRVRGPENLLRAMKPEDLTAWVDLRQMRPSDLPVEVPVRVDAPAWLTVDPARVQLTLRGQ